MASAYAMQDITADPAPEHRQSFVSTVQSIRRLGDSLPALVAEVESAFMTVGDGIATVGSMLVDLRALATEAASLAASANLQEAMGAFRQAIARLEAGDGEEGRLDSVQRLKTTAEALRGSCNDFRRLLRSLAFLAIAARVESARLGEIGAGFATLAGEMAAIVTRMEAALGQAEPMTASIGRETDNVQAQARTALEASNVSARQALRSLAANLSGFDELQGRMREGAEALAAKIDAIAGEMHGIVELLQTHDIVRQKLEHAQSILAEAADDAGWQNDAESLALLGHICGLQVRQLQQAADSFDGAVRGICASMEALSGELSGATAGLHAQADGAGALHSLAEVIAQAEAACQDASRHQNNRQELWSMLTRVAEAVRPLQEIFSGFGAMRADIQILSLNASIHAAQTGASGMALGAIATEVQRLAGSSSRLMDRNDSSLRAIGELAMELSAVGGGSGACSALAGSAAALRAVHGGMAGLTARLGHEADALARAIGDKLSQVRACAAAVARLRDSQADLANIAADLTHAAGGARLDARRLEALMERYTMESERRVHSMHVHGQSGHVADDGPGIELF